MIWKIPAKTNANIKEDQSAASFAKCNFEVSLCFQTETTSLFCLGLSESCSCSKMSYSVSCSLPSMFVSVAFHRFPFFGRAKAPSKWGKNIAVKSVICNKINLDGWFYVKYIDYVEEYLMLWDHLSCSLHLSLLFCENQNPRVLTFQNATKYWARQHIVNFLSNITTPGVFFFFCITGATF